MAVGEYVSVHSQADTEQAELKRERVELRTTRASTGKLAAIYVARGLDPSLAKQVAMQLMGRACSRRIRHHGDSHCASASGCIDVGCQFRAWSGVASPGHCHRSGGGSDPFVFWYLTGTLRASGGVAARTGGAGVSVGAKRVLF